MFSDAALTVTAIVPEYVGLTRSPSPAMTRVRSDGVVPQRLIQRRIGNQYSTENVRITKSVGSMSSSSRLRSRCHPLRAAIASLGKEIGEFVADDLRLPEHGMPPRFETDKPSAGDALDRALTRLVRGELVVFRVDDQGRH